MNRDKIRLLTATGLLSALTFLTTYFLHIPIGASGGYIHFGDAVIYLAAAILPLPYAAAAAAIGAGLSDILVPGGMIWLPATLLIKPLCCLAFARHGKIVSTRNTAAVVVAGLITIVGYGITTALVFGSVAVAIAELPMSIIQPVSSALLYFALGAGLDKTPLMGTQKFH